MTKIHWKHCVGQQHVKSVLGASLTKGTVGHAYLFSGEPGAGKFAAALDLALALLCKNNAAQPCMVCDACTRVLRYAHPDFRVLMPLVAKEKDDDLSEKEWGHIPGLIRERMAKPYALLSFDKKPNIPVALMREANHAIRRGPIEAPMNVTIIDAVDTMNSESANTMLKLLEEPPAGTIMLLLTGNLPAVLPTIVSRCQMLRFAYLSPGEIREGLAGACGIDKNDPRLGPVLDCGSIGRALQLFENPAEVEESAFRSLWTACTEGNWEAITPVVDGLAEWGDLTMYDNFFSSGIRQIRKAFLGELGGTGNVFSGGPAEGLKLESPATVERAETLAALCQNALASVKAHGSATLVLVNFALALTEILNGKKQQTG
ncbi:MAG: DNA polymerase III subunit [Chitinispirillaceae bacterium]|jgi:DNA polymerase-3 subunit delta'|nr:DNA polymerase III subunit [Chitinispirillaceae bacterium]